MCFPTKPSQVMSLWLTQAFEQQAFPRSCHRKCGIAFLGDAMTKKSIFHAMHKEASACYAFVAVEGILIISFANILP